MSGSRFTSFQQLLEEYEHLLSRVEILERSLDCANVAQHELAMHANTLQLVISAACTAISQRALPDYDEEGTYRSIVERHGLDVGIAYKALRKALTLKYRSTSEILFQTAPNAKG